MEHKVLRIIVYRTGKRVEVGFAELFSNGEIHGRIEEAQLNSPIITNDMILATDDALVIEEVSTVQAIAAIQKNFEKKGFNLPIIPPRGFEAIFKTEKQGAAELDSESDD